MVPRRLLDVGLEADRSDPENFATYKVQSPTIAGRSGGLLDRGDTASRLCLEWV